MPALQDLGTASPLQKKKSQSYDPWAPPLSRLRYCATLLSLWAPAFPRLEQRFCSAGEGLIRFTAHCPRLISGPAFLVSHDSHCLLLSGTGHFEAGQLLARLDFYASPALSGTHGCRVLLFDERVQHSR